MASEPKEIGTIDGWQITQDADGVLTATKDGQRPVRVGGQEGIDPGVLRSRLFTAMAEADGVAATGGGSVAPAGGGATAHAATIVVHDEKD